MITQRILFDMFCFRERKIRPTGLDGEVCLLILITYVLT